MIDHLLPRVEVDGGAPTRDQLSRLAMHSYGHFTAMQVRSGAVRGLELHLARLASANREMFDADVDGDRVRELVRHALGDVADASVRVSLVTADPDDAPVTMVTVRPPSELSARPHRMLSVPYQRPLPHLKQVGGGFGQVYHHRLAQRRGYTEILLTAPDGSISEGGITNVVFFDGTDLVWPTAPQLAGVTMGLVEPRLAAAGLPTRRADVRMAELPSFGAVFVTNSHGVAPVERIDDLALPVADELLGHLTQIYESVAWDGI